MLDLKSVEIWNFLSYGNYATKVELANQGSTFIYGEIADAAVPEESSNGAGKSTLMQAILWCLSGRTMHDKSPGNNVVNWFTNEPCKVKVIFKDGREIIRIRHNNKVELLYTKDGQNLIDSTLSTTGNMQKLLDIELGIDWDIFCGSVFCSQYNQPWMEMGDQTRKKILEKITGVDRFTTYAQVTKRKYDGLAKQLATQEEKKILLDANLEEQRESLSLTKEKREAHEEDRKDRQREKRREIKEEKERIASLKTINVEKLTKKWKLIRQATAKYKKIVAKNAEIEEYADDETVKAEEIIIELREAHETGITDLETKHENAEEDLDDKIDTKSEEMQKLFKVMTSLESKISVRSKSIKKWEDSDGEMCLECEQNIPHTHTSGKVEELQSEINTLQEDADKKQIQDSKNEEEYKELERTKHKLKKSNKVELQELRDKQKRSIDKVWDETNERVAESNAKAISRKKLKEINDGIEDNTPKVTVKEADSHNESMDRANDRIAKMQKQLKKIKDDSNPVDDLIRVASNRIITKEKEIEQVEEKIGNFTIVLEHLKYIQRSYTDRTKIKKYAITRHIPYFNRQLNKYSEIFCLDIKIGLTDTLSLTSTMWGYKYMSGGERKRYDVAFMLAIMDLHEAIYGKQSNILVLDEVDSDSDQQGVNDMINIVQNVLLEKFESIFIISHNSKMRYVYPSQLMIRRTDRLSQVIKQ